MKQLRLVTPRFGPQVIGGAESIARRLGLELVRRGWSVEVWTTTAVDEATWRPALMPGDEYDDGILVRRFPIRMRRRPGFFRQVTRGFYRTPARLRAETPWLIAQGPYSPALVRALSHAEPMPALFIPYLFYPTLWGLPAAPHPRILIPAAHDEPPLRLRAVKRAVAAADALWYSTPEERDLLTDAHPEAQSKPSAVGTVAVSAPPHLDPDGFRRRHNIEGPYLYYGGRAVPGKGLDLLLEALLRIRLTHPSVRLVLSGEAGVGTSGEGIVAMGMLDDQQRWNALAGAAAVVVPGRFESLSLLALEAWAVGRPCLLNNSSPVLAGQAQRSGGAYLFGTVEQLTAAATEVVTDPALASQRGEAGRAYVAENYTWDAVVDRLSGLIAEVSR